MILHRFQRALRQFKANPSDKEEALRTVEALRRKHLEPFEGTDLEPFARTVAQYHAVIHFRTKGQLLLRGAASIPLLAGLLLRTVLLPRLPEGDSRAVDAIKYGTHREYETPGELSSLDIVTVEPIEGLLSWGEAWNIIRGLVRVGCWSPEVHFKVLRDLGRLGHLLRRYRPRFMLLYREYEYSSSLMTHFLKARGLPVYDVMHGDVYYNLLSCFFTFDRFYIWHPRYEEIARALHAKVGEYVVYTPDRFKRVEGVREPTTDVLFLVPGYPIPPAEREALVASLRSLLERWRVTLRPHPRYDFNQSILDEILPAFPERAVLSDPSQEAIMPAILRARLMVGYASTALIEAHFQGLGVVCVQDRVYDQIGGYHPFFGDPAIVKLRPEALGEGVAGLLEREGRV